MHPNEARQMGVGFDPAGNHDLACGINYTLRFRHRIIQPCRNDPLSLDTDTPLADALGRDYIAAPDQDIEH
jgi:hypothetical protein